jgi:hypothetical protein
MTFLFYRKWAFGIRKISSKGNLEKSNSMGGHDARNLQKQISKNKFKVRSKYFVYKTGSV